MTMANPGREYEEAVDAFVRTLDPSAEVIFDHKVPDRDTGSLRQCDVWINAKIGGHWPYSILVSCKDWNKKLDVGEIGKFVDEVRSTGANLGIIYSKTGFTKDALKKAKANSLSCCRLYLNEPPDIPELIWFEFFTCNQSLQIKLVNDLSDYKLDTWNDLFNCEAGEGKEKNTVMDIIKTAYSEGENESLSKAGHANSFPPHWASELSIHNVHGVGEVKLHITVFWKKYRAPHEAQLINGSYSLSDGSFVGSFTGPIIDTWSDHPGSIWEEVKDPDFIPPINMALVMLSQGNIDLALRTGLGDKPLGG